MDVSQTRAIGRVLHFAATNLLDGVRTVKEILDSVETRMDEEGLDVLSSFPSAGPHPGNLARPRRFEIAAALNRLRTVRMVQRS